MVVITRTQRNKSNMKPIRYEMKTVSCKRVSAVLKQPLILPFLCSKSATTCPINSSKVANSNLKHRETRLNVNRFIYCLIIYIIFH